MRSDEKQKREEAAIALTAERYGRSLYSIAYNLLHDDCDTEEVLNDTYLDAWNSIPPARPDCLFAFLVKVVRGNALNAYEHRHRERRIPPHMVVSLSELDDCLGRDDAAAEEDSRTIAAVINRYLEQTTERRRFIFVCRYGCGDPIRKIAGMLKVSESTVNKELAAMREELRIQLEKEGITI